MSTPPDPTKLQAVDAWYWADRNKLRLGGGQFCTVGHEYQIGPLQCDARRQCYKKGAQMGFTEVRILKTFHGCIYSRYPRGYMYLFPTKDDVRDFSKARLNPLIDDNPESIGHYVQNTDAAHIKRVGQAMLYMRGARATAKIGGVKKTSSQLKSAPVDGMTYDETDEMDPDMIDLARERMSHSGTIDDAGVVTQIAEEGYLSTPSIPEFGIDVLYEASDQRIWVLYCPKCGKYTTCLEMEFPDCLHRRPDGSIIRICIRCRDREIHPRDGQWVAQHPDRADAMVGWWISQLASVYVDPGTILDLFLNPPRGNVAEVYNSKLARAYIEAENKLTRAEVFSCCGHDAMANFDKGPTAMGVDVGKKLHVLIGYRKTEKLPKIIYAGRVDEFQDLHDLAKRFGVRCTVIDGEPETRKAKEFRDAEDHTVYLCDYPPHSFKQLELWDEKKQTLTLDRTYSCDHSHRVIADGEIELPRRNQEINQVVKEICNIARIKDEDPKTGAVTHTYKKLGPDHYRHTLNYFSMAVSQIPVARQEKRFRPPKVVTDYRTLPARAA